MARTAKAILIKNQVVKGHMQIKRIGNIQVQTWQRIEKNEEAVLTVIREEELKRVRLFLRVRKK